MSEEKTKAHEMAKKQREISVSEFFEKNRHLLGFDNKRKALLTTIKEAVDNSLDACDEAGILPEIIVQIIEMGEEKFRVIIEDNGPGIVKAQIPNIFARLLYGSKFHSMRQSRGQQGIGISAAALYGQLTTGRPIKITSKIGPNKPGNYFELLIDTSNNRPNIIKEEEREFKKDQGTRIEIDLEGIYQKGAQSVDTYIKQTAIINPHCTIIYTTPKAEQFIFPRATDNLPKQPQEIKPHPYGIELGILIRMLSKTVETTLNQFLITDFSRVSPSVAKEICETAKIDPRKKPDELSRDDAEKIYQAIQKTKIISPPTDCISPIGSEDLEKGLRKEVPAEFYCSTTRPPTVYRGNPFVIECAIAYGGQIAGDEPIKVMRFANRVPLQFQQAACGLTKSIIQTQWRGYGLSQPRNALPVGPCVVVLHMASVWVPYTSEAKEAIAHYPEILKEVKLALQECGRKLASYTNKKKKIGDEFKKRGYIEKYIKYVSGALVELLEMKKTEEDILSTDLKELLEQKRGALEDITDKNEEYDEEWAKIGKEESEEDESEEDSDDESGNKKSKKQKEDYEDDL